MHLGSRASRALLHCPYYYAYIGNPPVIGDDRMLYGFYETPDIVSIPIVPAGNKVEPEELYLSR